MAGTVVLTSQRSEGVIRYARILATADEADGSFPTKTLRTLGVNPDGIIIGVITNPGAVAPTDNWDATLPDGDGFDRFNGALANRDTATTEYAAIGLPVSPDDTLTLTIAGNSVNSATIEFVIFWTPSASAGAATSSSSSASNTQYAEGATAATITGTAAMWEDLSDTLRAVSVAKPLPIQSVVATAATITVQTDQATSVTLLSSDTTRKGFRIYNDSDQALYIKYGTTASTTDYTVLLPAYGTLFEDNYSGRVDGIWAADSSGSARVTSLA